VIADATVDLLSILIDTHKTANAPKTTILDNLVSSVYHICSIWFVVVAVATERLKREQFLARTLVDETASGNLIGLYLQLFQKVNMTLTDDSYILEVTDSTGDRGNLVNGHAHNLMRSILESDDTLENCSRFE
jgi:hypothetical protein